MGSPFEWQQVNPKVNNVPTCKMSVWIKVKALIKLQYCSYIEQLLQWVNVNSFNISDVCLDCLKHTNTQQIHAAQCLRASRRDPILSDSRSDLTVSFTMRQTSYLCLSRSKEIKTLHAVQKFQLHHQGDIYLLSRFSLAPPPPPTTSSTPFSKTACKWHL